MDQTVKPAGGRPARPRTRGRTLGAKDVRLMFGNQAISAEVVYFHRRPPARWRLAKVLFCAGLPLVLAGLVVWLAATA